MTKLEEKICEEFKVNYGVFTGNGTTAMYLAFLSCEMQDKKVIFPAISCTNPVNAAIFAGYQVDFCDVNIDDYTIDLYELDKMLQKGEYGIVVPTHIYGHRYDEEKVRALCTKYNVILFEDAAQSYYVGDMDVSVMSFGHTKAYEATGEGGIALTNNIDIYKRMVEKKKEISKNNIIPNEAFDEYRTKYYSIVKSSNDWETRNLKLRELQLNSKKYFIFDSCDNFNVIDKISQSKKIIDLRRKKTRLYQECLNDKCTIKPYVLDEYRWRYSFLYNGDREYLLSRAREKGIDISSWYFSLAGIYKNQHLLNADKIESEIVNLWIDESHSLVQIKNEINILNKIMEEDCERYK